MALGHDVSDLCCPRCGDAYPASDFVEVVRRAAAAIPTGWAPDAVTVLRHRRCRALVYIVAKACTIAVVE